MQDQPLPQLHQLQLACTPRFVGSDGAAVALAARDAAMLAWLALEGPTPRTRLAQLLWPDSDAGAARNALRQRLFQLRKSVGCEAVVGSATLSLAAGLTHDLEDADSVLGDAVAAAGGEFAAWLEQQRQRRRGRTRQSLAELSQMAEDARDWADALSHAHELLTLEPLSEAAHRRVMRLHYLAGDRAAALLAFDRCEQVLKDEVGARPSAETLALLATLEQAATGGALSVGNALPASVLRPPRLIGRENELAQLTQGFASGQVVAVVGDAGLGKTRLLQEFAQAHTGLVHVSARPGDAGVPFASLARLLRAVTVLAPPALEDGTRREIARVLPEFDSAAPRAIGEGQRLVLQRAVQAMLISQQDLAGLLLDDLHFADPASLDMLLALIDATGSDDGQRGAGLPSAPPLRFVLAYRPSEAGSPLRALHDALVEQVRLQPLALAPLDEASLAALVDSLGLPGINGRALAPGLLQRTGGNPLFVLETLKQAWVERTLERLADARHLPKPLSVGRLIERRLGQLSPAALALARVASIAGVDFEIELAEQVLGASAMQFADALNELEAAQVLRGNAFAHDLVFEAVQASVPATIAARTHGQVAAWLEARAGEPARIAQHWIAAGQGVAALPWLAKAAAAAGAALRAKEQVAFLELASAIAESTGALAAAFESLMQAAELQVTLDRDGYDGARQCDRLDRLAANPAQRIRARLQRSHVEQMRGALPAAEALAREALREATRSGADAALTIECRHRLAITLSGRARSLEAIGHFEACISWFDEHAGDAERLEFHGNLALTYDSLGRLADAAPHHEVAIALAQRTGHQSNFTMCLSNFAANRILGGHLRDGGALLARSRLAQAQADDPSSVAGFSTLMQAICDYQSGHYRQALRALDQSLANLTEFAPGYRLPVLTHFSVCWAYLGQWARLHRLLAEIGDGPDMPPSTRLRTLLARHAIDLAKGHPDPLRLEAALTFAPEGEAPDVRHMVLLELAMTRPPLDGLALIDSVRAAASALGHDGTLIAAHARSARLAATLGDRARARAHVDAALDTATHASMVRQYPAELWLHCGAALQACGDMARAREVLAGGRDWINTIVDAHVPAEFRDSFLHRNPVNRELLALAARLAPA